MDEWITVRQAAQMLDISTQRCYTLIGNGTLSSKKIGLTRVVNRRSVATYKESPSRNKYAGGNLRPLDVAGEQPGLPGMGGETLDDWEARQFLGGDVDHWQGGLRAPMLSVEARRLYDESPIGQRNSRIARQVAEAGGE